MYASDAQIILQDCGAVLEGHFEYASGLHGKRYLEKAKILVNPQHIFELGRCMADALASNGVISDLVCSPAIGGIPIGYMTALHLNNRFIPIEYNKKKLFMIRKSFVELLHGVRIVFVDDIKTTGRTMEDCINLLISLGGEVVYAGFIADVIELRATQFEYCVPFISLVTSGERAWSKQDCPLCKNSVPLVKLSERNIPQTCAKK